MRFGLWAMAAGLALVGASSARAQFFPVVSKVREVTTTSINGKVVSTERREGMYYRAADGSTLERWTSVNGDPSRGDSLPGRLWDNRKGVGYEIDFKNRVAFLRPAKPGSPASRRRRPNTAYRLAWGSRRRASKSIEGIRCLDSPIYPSPRDKSHAPLGTVCESPKYDLQLERDTITRSKISGKTVHTVYELHDIQLGVEPDPKLFDVEHRFAVDVSDSGKR